MGIFTFIASWNNFIWPYMVTNNPDLMTMPNGIIAGLPLIAAFVLFQSQIVRGVAHTGLAGQ